MPTARWGAAIGVLALGGAVILRRPELPPPVRDEVQAAEPALTLVVAIDAVRLDLRRVHLCLTPMRHEERPVEHRGELAADGRFHFTGLADTDYRLELLTRGPASAGKASLRGAIMFMARAAAAGSSVARRRPIRLRAAEFRLPKPGISLKQAMYSARNYYP